MTSVMVRHPYIRYRRGRSHTLGIDVADWTASMTLYLCIVGICSETKNLCVDRRSPCVRVRSGTGAMEEQAGPTSSIANVWVK